MEDQAPAQAENAQEEVVLTREKFDDYKKKLSGTKAEALRLKSENEAAQLQIQRLKAEAEALRTGQGQAYGYQPTPQEVEVFKQLAKQSGIPLKEEIQYQKAAEYDNVKNEMVKEFLIRHPEYAEGAGEEADVMWNELKGEVMTYIPPNDPKDYLKLMEKAHKILHFDGDKAIERGKALGKAEANLNEQAKVGGGGSSSKASAKLSPEQKAVADGFKQAAPGYF